MIILAIFAFLSLSALVILEAPPEKQALVQYYTQEQPQ